MHRRLVGPLVGLLAVAALAAGTVVGLRSALPGPAAEGVMLRPAPRPSDAGLLRLLAKLDPRSRVLRALTFDLDGDGDLDVIATTTDDVVVWENTGRSRLVRRTPRPTPRFSTLPGLGNSSAGGQTATLPNATWAGAVTRAVGFGDGNCSSALLAAKPSHAIAPPSDATSGRAPPSRSLRA